MDNLIRTTISKSNLEVGMTVELYGELLTVGKEDLSYCSFMGHSFRGSVYPKTVTRVQFTCQTPNGIVIRPDY